MSGPAPPIAAPQITWQLVWTPEVGQPRTIEITHHERLLTPRIKYGRDQGKVWTAGHIKLAEAQFIPSNPVCDLVELFPGLAPISTKVLLLYGTGRKNCLVPYRIVK